MTSRKFLFAILAFVLIFSGCAKKEDAPKINNRLGAEVIKEVATGQEPSPEALEKIQLEKYKQIEDVSGDILKAISLKDFKKVASYVGSDKDLCFSPYANIGQNVKCFSKKELETAFDDGKEHVWGVYDGRGDDIVLTFPAYYDRFIYNKDYLNKGDYTSGDPGSTSGNIMVNLKEAYPNGFFSKYYVEGEDSELDWGAIRFVFEEYDNKLWLRAIVHDQWTI